MNYQNILCLGDSQTFGARSYGCYPLYLAKFLSERSPYLWRTINRGANRYTVRDLWFRVNEDIDTIQDVYQACILIGTNDAGEQTPPSLFAEYYRQLIQALLIKKYRALFCGEIPPIFPDGHVFFPRRTLEAREQYNTIIGAVAKEFSEVQIVGFSALTRDDYEDPVHFNESGNQKVAHAFAEVILSR